MGPSALRRRGALLVPDARLPHLHTWSQMAAKLPNVNALLESDQAYRGTAMTTRAIALELAHARTW